MDRNTSHGRHGGNRGAERDDSNPSHKPENSDVTSKADDRNVDKAGGRKFGQSS
jgi:hypothetical protein